MTDTQELIKQQIAAIEKNNKLLEQNNLLISLSLSINNSQELEALRQKEVANSIAAGRGEIEE